MNPIETRQFCQVLFTLGILSAFVICYVRGGRGQRAIRFLGGGLTFSLGCCLLALWSGVASWWMVFSIPAYVGALTVGYGAETTAAKIRRRALYGLGVGSASIPLLLPLGLWWPFLYQVGLSVFTSVVNGVTNQTSAVGEEGLISLGMVLTVPFMLIQ